jgi:hypothetical protein
VNPQISGRRLRFTFAEPWKTLADARDLFKDYAHSPIDIGTPRAVIFENAEQLQDRPAGEERASEGMWSVWKKIRTFFIHAGGVKHLAISSEEK